MSRRAALIDDDDRSRPSIPIRLSTSSCSGTPVKASMDDDSFQSQVRAVSRSNRQHSLKSQLTYSSDTVANDSDGYLAESENGADDASGEVASIDAIRDVEASGEVTTVDADHEIDDVSTDITSVGDAQTADASILSNSDKVTPQTILGSTERSESNPTLRSELALTPPGVYGVSAFHAFPAEDGPDLEVQLKESHETQQITDPVSDEKKVDEDDESELQLPVEDGNRLPERNGRSKDGLSKRLWMLLAILFIIIVASFGAAIGSVLERKKSRATSNGLSSPTASPAISPDASPSVPKCTFCYDGTVPANLGNSTIRNNTSCLDFSNQLTRLFATDPLCSTGQALAWRYCGCPSLPSPPLRPSCTLCPNGTTTTNASTYCAELANLVAIVGSSRLSNCDDLRTQALPTCGCPNNVARKAAFRDLLSTVPGLNISGNATTWQRAALHWISNEDFARIAPTISRVKEIAERYVAALLFFATSGRKWRSSANFLSESGVCTWNNNNIGLFCNGANELVVIDLSSNNLEGVIPSEISTLTGLVAIALKSNNLSGPLPNSIGTLRRLVALQVQNNALTSTVPSSIFESSSIQEVLISNNLFQGTLPASMGSASQLHALVARSNALTGTLPNSLKNLSSLEILDLQNNLLSGTVPQLQATLPLVAVNLGRNFFSGTIPDTMTSAPGLRALRLAKLNLTGPLPDFAANNGSLVLVELFGNQLTGNLGKFLSAVPPSIVSLELHQNLITGEIATTIGRLTQLNVLNLYQNKLHGTIPTEIGLLTQLGSLLQINGNTDLTGTLPTELGRLTNLEHGLYIYSTGIHGRIPTELGRLTRLQNIALGSNHLTGSVPSQLGNLSLLRLSLSDNFLTGNVDSLFSFLPVSLVLLRVDGNLLNGTIPSTMGAYTNITSLTLQLNHISGFLPSEVGLLAKLGPIFDLHGNTIMGTIPSEIGYLSNLELLDLGSNQFSSSLPSELGLLTSLTAVDLSGNILTGSMPSTFAMLPRLNTLLIFDNNITDVDSVACKRFANISFFVANSCNGSKVACKCCTNCCVEGSKHCPAVRKRRAT